MLALTATDVRTLVPMADAIPLMKAAFADLSAGRAYAPVRTPIPTAAENGMTLVMPAAVPSVAGLGLKVVSVFPHNPARGKPLIYALVVLVDPTDGSPLAVLDGTGLTALRTGAVSGTATDLLARPDAQVLALFGAGVQAVTQARAICAVRSIADIRVYARTPERVAQFIAGMRETDPKIGAMMRFAHTPTEALQGAQIVCTATTATAPLFDDADIAPGTHLNAVGAYTPAMQEIPPETVGRAYVVVDQHAAVWEEAGDLIRARDAGLLTEDHVTELGAIVNGNAAGRTHAAQITLFKSVGNAVQDIAVARLAVDRARERGMGQEITL